MSAQLCTYSLQYRLKCLIHKNACTIAINRLLLGGFLNSTQLLYTNEQSDNRISSTARELLTMVPFVWTLCFIFDGVQTARDIHPLFLISFYVDVKRGQSSLEKDGQ